MKWWHWIILSLALLLASIGLFFGVKAFLSKKQTAGLQIITRDTTCSVFLNDQYLDKTPVINKEIKPGNYELRLEPDNPKLAPYQTQIKLRQGLLTVVTWRPGLKPETSGGIIYELEPIAGRQAQLAFITIPDNVLVKLDQKKPEFSPVTFKNLEPGHHQFKLTLPAYVTQDHTINLIKGHRVTVTAKMARDGQEASLKTNPDATPSARLATISAQLNDESATTSAQVLIKKTNFYQDEQEVLRVRAEASADAKQIGWAQVGKKYPCLEIKDYWYQIQIEDQVGIEDQVNIEDQVGWVSGDYAELD